MTQTPLEKFQNRLRELFQFHCADLGFGIYRIMNHKRAVIRRETQGWTMEDYQRDAAFIAEHNLATGADEVYANGDSRIPRARSLDPIFKERMFAGVGV